MTFTPLAMVSGVCATVEAWDAESPGSRLLSVSGVLAIGVSGLLSSRALLISSGPRFPLMRRAGFSILQGVSASPSPEEQLLYTYT